MSTDKNNILAIYAVQDKQVLKYLSLHLKPLVTEFDLSFQSDAIHPEQKWRPENVSSLDEVDLFLFLLSNSFMYSQFIEQDEFKTIIDNYKAGTAKVIPIIIDNCPWDAEFTSDDYNFSFKELQVFPKNRKPLGDWNSTDEAFKQVTDHIGTLFASSTETIGEENESSLKSPKTEKQIAIDFFEEQLPEQTSEKEKKVEVSAVEPKEKVYEKNILQEEVEAKTASKKDKWRRQKTETQKRIEKEKELKEKAKNDVKTKEKVESQDVAEEENKSTHETKAKNETNIATVIAEAEVLRAENGLDTEEIKRPVLAPKSKRKKNGFAGQNYQFKPKTAEQMDTPFHDNQKAKPIDAFIESLKKVTDDYLGPQFDKLDAKKIRSGGLILIVFVVGFFVISKVLMNSEDQPTKLSESETTIVDGNSKDVSDNQAAAILELGVGDNYEDGIIFALGPNNIKGTIASFDDLGPMPWQEAIKIDDKLGEGWRLPTLEELQAMYGTIGQGASNEGEFADGLYWSATPYGEYQARLLRFKDGNTSYHYNKMVPDRQFLVRAVRDFGQ